MVSAYESLINVANESKSPLIASDPDPVSRGAAEHQGILLPQDYIELAAPVINK